MTNIRAVEGVSELDGVAISGSQVGLLLGDGLGTIEVVLDSNNGLGCDEDRRVGVCDPVTANVSLWNEKLARSAEDLQDGKVLHLRVLAVPGKSVDRLGD